MAATDALLASLNSGEVSRLALARVDLAKLRVACEKQLNFLPHVLGPTMVRPGTKYITPTETNQAGWLGEFSFDEVTKALLVITPSVLQFLIDDAYLARGLVTAAVANGNFDTNLASWTLADEAGAVSVWDAGFLSLTGTGANYAFRDQQVTVNEIGVEHALRLFVTRGYVSLKVGTSAGDGTYWDLGGLATGVYSLAFIPAGASFWIRLGSNTTYPSIVNSINIEGAGTVSLPVPYTTTPQFDQLRYDQSGNVIFFACAGFQQRRIERRQPNPTANSSRSWAVVLYLADDGPFRNANLGRITIAANVTTGAGTLTADRPLFQPGHAGALFRLRHTQQTATSVLAGASQFTNHVRVAGLGQARALSVIITGTFAATVVLQRSLGVPGAWSSVTGEAYTGPTSKTYVDTLDNQIVYYRLGIDAGGYTSGAATSMVVFGGSIQAGVARIKSVTSSTAATADVLQQFGSNDPTDDWDEGEWSDYRGWPAAVAFHDGRLFWQMGINIQGSISDAFHSFDDEVVGDSATINRTIATGGLDGGRWLLSLQLLMVGTASQEISIRADALGGVLTPAAFVARVCGDAGAAKVRPLRLATIGAYVGRNAKRLFKFAINASSTDYTSAALDRLKPEMFAAGIRDLAVQRQPDNAQIWAILGDGTAAVITHDPQEDVAAMIPVTTPGSFERVAVLPGNDEDDVYFIVSRAVGGVTKRYIEKLAKRSECVGGLLSKTMDSHIVYSGAPTATLSGGLHLAGLPVAVWADGAPLATYDAPLTVSGAGEITLPLAVSNAVWGEGYLAQLKTVKLAYGAERGTAVEMMKRIARVGLVMADVAWKGVRIGRNFDNLAGLPGTYRGKALTDGQVLPAYDAVPASFNGGWDSDARVCIEVKSPYPCTIMGLVLQMATNEPDDAGPQKQERP